MSYSSKLTIGPILFHWPAEQKRDFYFRIADEVQVDTVYIGEVICGKRAPYFEQHYEEVAERLSAAGIDVVYSTLSEVMIRNDRQIVAKMCADESIEIEANDASALQHLVGKKHSIGPFLNVYNEWTMSHLAHNGATHITLPPELPGEAMDTLGDKSKELGVTLEVQVYGRIPLALSARCYHARAHDRVKDNCQFVCEEDPDGLNLSTLAGEPFLTVNGIQTLSHTCLNLMHELEGMQAKGVSAFRLSPQSQNMVETAQLFRRLLGQEIDATEASARLAESGLDVPFSNGFYHQTDGFRWVENR